MARVKRSVNAQKKRREVLDAASTKRDVAYLDLHHGPGRVQALVGCHGRCVAVAAVSRHDDGAVGQVGIHVGCTFPLPDFGVIVAFVDDFDIQPASAGIGLAAQGRKVPLAHGVMRKVFVRTDFK